ncbi:MAG: TOBE domain-containing protein [Bacteroidia bacterium]
MNILNGNILEIKTEGSLSLVKVTAHNCVITSLLIDTPMRSEYLKEGNKVNVVFKETEVILAKQLEGLISVQNKLNCIVEHVERGELLCKITMDFQGVKLISIITRNAFDQLKITEKEKIVALIKSTEVSLAPNG